MESQSLNCSVFFNPNSVNADENISSDCLNLEDRRHMKPLDCLSGGNLFTITYVPQERQKISPRTTVNPSNTESVQNKGAPLCRSCVKIEECLGPNSKKHGHLKMNYVLDDQVKCDTCWELKQVLDYTIQKLHNAAQAKQQRGGVFGKVSCREIRKKCRSKKHYRSGRKMEENSEMSKSFANEVEDVGPLADFFSRLIRAATISRMKNFSRSLEEKISKLAKKASHLKNSPDSISSVNATKKEDGKKENLKKTFAEVNTCESCERLQQSIYHTVSKLYESAGLRTDFPTVKKLETYAFLVYPNEAQCPSTCKRVNESNPKKSSFSAKSEEPSHNLQAKSPRMKGKRRSDETRDDENRRLLRSRIKQHKAAFTASKFVHIATALAVSLSTIILISMDWVITEHHYSPRVVGVMIVLFVGCIYNLYLMSVLGVYSFKNYFIIPVCWVVLSLSNEKCTDPLMPNHICDSKIHFMSHVYLFIVFLEYYLASGIHAVLVLEINQFREIPLKDLLKYSLFNLPLMIIVLIYLTFKFSFAVMKRIKRYIMKHFFNVNWQKE